MSEENITKEALELVKEAQSAKVFNLADAIKGRAYPTTSVKIYLDDESAMKLVDVNLQMNRTTDPEALAELEKIAAELAKQIMQSALTFEMRGVGQSVIEAITDKLNALHGFGEDESEKTQDWLKDYITHLVAVNIVSVTNSEGAVDKEAFDYEKVEELRKGLSVTEWNKLVGAMQKLTLAGGYFDQLTDAGFLQKS